MQTRFLILFAGLFMIMCSSFAQNFNKISKDIRKQQLLMEPREKICTNYYYSLRKKTNILKEFSPTSKNDTVFILESHGDFSDPILLSTVWNMSKKRSYYSKDFGKTFSVTKKAQFFNYMRKLVSEWNVAAIRKEEIENAHITPVEYIYATRIIFNGKKYQIDCLDFKFFFNFERDGLIHVK